MKSLWLEGENFDVSPKSPNLLHGLQRNRCRIPNLQCLGLFLKKKSFMFHQIGISHNGLVYCEHRYFRVYKFLRISENWQFHVDLFSRF